LTKGMNQVLLKGAAAVLWLATVVLGLVEIVILHTIILNLYTFFAGYEVGTQETFQARYRIGAFYSFSFVILSILWLLFFVISSHYHFKYAAQPRSWRLFAWTVAIQLLILVIGFLI